MSQAKLPSPRSPYHEALFSDAFWEHVTKKTILNPDSRRSKSLANEVIWHQIPVTLAAGHVGFGSAHE